MLSSLLPPFLGTYSLTTSSLECKALCMVICFHIFCFICLNSPRIHFKYGLEFATLGTALVFIPFIKFLLFSLFSNSFLVLLRYASLIFTFISTCLIMSASNYPMHLYVSFSPCDLIFSWFGSSISSVFYRFQFFITSIAYFSIPNSVFMSWLFIIIIIHTLELFTSALADGFSLESEWQQVSSSLQDAS